MNVDYSHHYSVGEKTSTPENFHYIRLWVSLVMFSSVLAVIESQFRRSRSSVLAQFT